MNKAQPLGGALLRSALPAPGLTARAHSLTLVVYWVPFPRAFGARRG